MKGALGVLYVYSKETIAYTGTDHIEGYTPFINSTRCFEDSERAPDNDDEEDDLVCSAETLWNGRQEGHGRQHRASGVRRKLPVTTCNCPVAFSTLSNDPAGIRYETS